MSLVNSPVPTILSQQFLSAAPDGVPIKQKPILLDFSRKRMHGKETRKQKGETGNLIWVMACSKGSWQPEPLVTQFQSA